MTTLQRAAAGEGEGYAGRGICPVDRSPPRTPRSTATCDHCTWHVDRLIDLSSLLSVSPPPPSNFIPSRGVATEKSRKRKILDLGNFILSLRPALAMHAGAGRSNRFREFEQNCCEHLSPLHICIGERASLHHWSSKFLGQLFFPFQVCACQTLAATLFEKKIK